MNARLLDEEIASRRGPIGWARRRPLEFQHQHGLVSHASRPTQHRFDSGVDRLHDAEPHRMVAVGGDPVEMLEEEVAQPFHLGQSLPAQCADPPIEEVEDPGTGLIGPEAIELLAQDIRFEQAPVHREERAAARPASIRARSSSGARAASVCRARARA